MDHAVNLHELIKAEDAAGLRQAIVSGGDPNYSFPDSDECLLSTAAQAGRAGMVRLLLELGADPNHRESVTPPLTAAVDGGSLECARALIEAGAQIDVKDEDGSTPLMHAAAGGRLEIVQELLGRGANPKLKDRHRNTALAIAASKNHLKVCELLMPLATSKERMSAQITRDLLEQGIDDHELTSMFLSIAKGDYQCIREHVRETSNPDVVVRNGMTALMYAANNNHIEMARWLLDEGADVNRQSVDGVSALSCAAMGCHPEMYDYLYPLTDKKLRKRAEKIKQNQIDVGNWPADE